MYNRGNNRFVLVVRREGKNVGWGYCFLIKNGSCVMLFGSRVGLDYIFFVEFVC